ncbi:hypothetical protein, partial [Aeromonas caviae]|uniref:hypothetical protein n=1 Tax=Aeromonas caviae TaxID=648 RepID=UPI001F1F3C85
TTGQQVGARLKGKQGVMVGRKRLGDDGITWPEGGNINMMRGDSRVMVVVCLETASLPAPCLSTSTSPRSREEPFLFPIRRPACTGLGQGDDPVQGYRAKNQKKLTLPRRN